MKIPWRWITEFVETSLSPQDAADRLVNGGIEVASVTPAGPPLSGVVVGEIEAIDDELGEHGGHRLLVVRVRTGGGRFSVVCGAPNCRPGVRAAFAPPGAILPGGQAVEAVRIRGALSEGILCSERELGLGEEHERGILLLEPDSPLGADLLAALGLDDSVLDIEITPNRVDCLSATGIAREIAALTGAPLRVPRVSLAEAEEPVDALANVRIDDPSLCPRYALRVVSGVRVAPSPARIAARLRAAGLRPISNVVDVTNYVLWECGQPLHAFDHETVRDHTIVVRRARPGERLTTLDGQERTLGESMLVIADPERAIGIAGVMGGASTAVTDGTTRVLLEAAYFEPASIRRTSRALALPTDAAYRFERGADIDAPPAALERAAQLLAELAAGRVARGAIDVYPTPRSRSSVRLRLSRIQRVVGACPPADDVARVLTSLGLGARRTAAEFDVAIPTFRRDLRIEDDLVEEIARVWGYDNIPSTLPSGRLQPVRRPSTLHQANAIRRALQAAGLNEVITYSFADPAREVALGRDPERPEVLRLRNPLSHESSLLRADLIPGLLEVLATNTRRREPNVRIFEIGRQFVRRGAEPSESSWLGIALTGARREPAWHERAEMLDVFDAKGIVEHVLAVLQVPLPELESDGLEHPYFEKTRWGRLVAATETVAEFGEIAPSVRDMFGIPNPVFAVRVALDVAARLRRPPPTVTPLPRYPSVVRDLAFTVPVTVAAARVERVLWEAGGPFLRSVVMFDLYAGKGMAATEQSIAWRLTFRADDRTLTDAEVNEGLGHIIEAVRSRLDIQIRGME